MRHGSISQSRFRIALSAMGQQDLTDPQVYALGARYADPKRNGNVLWTSFMVDIEKGKCRLLFVWTAYILDPRSQRAGSYKFGAVIANV